LGVFLKRAGIPSTVFEAHPRSHGVGGGLGLGPNGVRVLDALGVADSVRAHAGAIQSYRFRNHRGSVLAAFDLDAEQRFGQPMLGASRAAVAEAVEREAHRAGVPIVYEKRLVGLEQDANGVTARFEDGTSAFGDLLIGADGVHSMTRQLALPGSPQPDFTGMVGIGGFVSDAAAALTAVERTSMTFAFGGRGFFGYSGGVDGQTMWWTNLPRSAPLSREELAQTSTDTLKRELLERFRDYFAPVPRLVEASESIMQVNVFDIQSLPTWSSGRVLVLGDAAHAVSPNAGQGAALALEDAMLLARLLRDSVDYRGAFAAFEAERSPRVERIVAEGRRRGADKQLVAPLQAKVREIMLRLMLNAFGKHADDWVWRYAIDWQDAEALVAAA
jgi:2-polyprenyl-6-methoxyphenol hydroxylase-like FAD-dependent oxidoreductase